MFIVRRCINTSAGVKCRQPKNGKTEPSDLIVNGRTTLFKEAAPSTRLSCVCALRSNPACRACKSKSCRRRGTRKRLVATESRREGVYNRAAAASVIACGEEPRRSGRAATFPTNRMFTQDNKNVAANDATSAIPRRRRGYRKRLVATESRRERACKRTGEPSVTFCGEEPRRSGRAVTLLIPGLSVSKNKSVAANDATSAATWRARHDTALLLIAKS